MTASRLVNLFAFSALAVLLASFQAVPVNAVSIAHRDMHLEHRSHVAIAASRKKRSASGKKCKPRPKPTDAPAPASSTQANKPTPTTQHHNTPVPSPNGPPPPSGGKSDILRGKSMLAWGSDPGNIPNFKGVKKLYNWSLNKPSTVNEAGIEFCYHYWGDRDTSQWQSQIMGMNPPPGCIMGFNEVNEQGQANMSPQHAAQLWKDNIEPVIQKGQTLAYGPSVSSRPNGLQWFKDFFAACNGGCTVHRINVHYYDITASGFQQYLQSFHDAFGRDVAITEFADQNFNGGAQASMGEVWDFAGQMSDFFANTPWIKDVAPFGAVDGMAGVNPDNSIMDNGHPNSLASTYLGI